MMKRPFPAWSFCALACVALLLGFFEFGKARGLDHRLNYGIAPDSWAISVASSRLIAGFHEGYLGYRIFYQSLLKDLAPDGVHGKESAKLVRDEGAIASAFDHIRAIPREQYPDYAGELTPQFQSMMFEDVGIADYYTLAFALFGFAPDAMYKLYFLIFAASIAIFLFAHRRHPLAMALLVLNLLAFGAMLFSPILYGNRLMPSVNSNRFLITLCLLPFFHLLLAAFKNERLARGDMIALLLQALIFCFALSARKTGSWMLIATFAMIAFAAWKRPHALRNAAAAGAILIATFLAYNAVQTAQLHKSYFSECVIPHHSTWHTAYRGLMFHPDFQKVVGHGKEAFVDKDIWTLSREVMKEKGLDPQCAETGGMPRVRVHEQIMFDQFWAFVFEHPRYMLELVFYYKPIAIARYVIEFFQLIWPAYWCGLIAASLLLGALAGRGYWLSRRQMLLGNGAMIALLGFSLLPPLFGYLNAYMVDIMWMSLLVILSGLFSAACIFTSRLLDGRAKQA